jgi:lipopolysaccharide export system protein LptA
MFRRILSALACLLILLIANWAYVVIVVPQVDPPLLADDFVIDDDWELPPSENQFSLTRLFPPDAWQLKSPKSIESDQAIILFQDYKPGDGVIELIPCTIVIFSGDKKEGSRRPYILQAPQGAIIRSDGILSLTQSSSGMVSAGRLVGRVSIHSPETEPGKGDSIRINTRNVQIDRQRIWTTNDVDFQLGPHHGRGRDLIINLSDVDNRGGQIERGVVGGQVDSMELIHLDQLQLQVSANPLNLDSSLPSEDNESDPLLLDIACDGPLRFDFQQLQLSLEDNVEMSFHREGKKPDQLTCMRLELSFLQPVRQGSEVSSQPGQSDPKLTATSALTPRKLVATGNPAILQSTSSNALVRGRQLSYEFANRNLVIDDPVQSVVVYGESQIIARSIAYQLPDGDTNLGQLHAQGAGTFQRQLEGNQKLVASWKEYCHLQRHDDEHVLSLKNTAVVSLGNIQRIASDQLHVWLKQIPAVAPQPGSDAIPSLGEPTAEGLAASTVKTPAAARGRLQIRPVKMAAIGNVELDTSQLSVRTRRAEIWVRHVAEVDLPPLQRNGTPITSSSRSPQTSLTRFSVKGDLVRAQLLDYGDQPVLSDITIQGNVTIKQLSADNVNARPPLLIHGDSLQMKRAANGLAAIEVAGKAAEGKLAWVAMREMELSGPSITLDQQTNQIQVVGAGQLTVHSPERNRPASQVTWNEQLLFDGRSAQLIGDVQSRANYQLEDGRSMDLLIMSGELEIQLSRKLDLANPRSAVPLELSQLIFTKDVFLQNKTRDAKGQDLSSDQLQVGRLVVNQQTGRIIGEGSGQARSIVRLASKAGTGPNAPPAATASSGLTNIQVHFDNGFDGDYKERIARFIGRVRSVYGPVENWEDTVKLGDPGPQGAELHCEQLTVADLSVIGRRGIELEAVGNTYIESPKYVARAHRLTFSQAKEVLVLEGGRQDAQIWLGENRTPMPNAAARRITYQLLTGKLEVNGVRYLELNRLP